MGIVRHGRDTLPLLDLQRALQLLDAFGEGREQRLEDDVLFACAQVPVLPHALYALGHELHELRVPHLVPCPVRSRHDTSLVRRRVRTEPLVNRFKRVQIVPSALGGNEDPGVSLPFELIDHVLMVGRRPRV
eukprot:2775819-Prorocentrum_lima.AAC.1